MTIELTLQVMTLLFIAAFIAGFIDAIAGGGGLITIPALLLAGIPPVHALGTNKLQALFGSGTAALTYARHGHVNLKEQGPAALLALFGAIAGALLATRLPTDWLKASLPILLIGIALYFALKPGMGEVERHRRLSPNAFLLGFIPVIGFYDGLFGPGTGSFFMLGFVALAGYSLLKATAHTKFLNFGSNIGGFLVFLAYGSILWKLGLLMGLGQFLGARMGALFAMKNGMRVIKPLLVIGCISLAARLIYQHWV